MIYGYARISRPTQNIERQIRNILEYEPRAHIVKESYTGQYLSKYMDRIFKRKDTITTYCTDIANAVKVYVADTKEFARRVAAISFFSKFKVFLNEYESAVKKLQTKFDSVYKTLTMAMSRIENRSTQAQENSSFKIDLTSRCINKLVLNKGQIIVSDFADSLDGEMLTLAGKQEEEVYE